MSSYFINPSLRNEPNWRDVSKMESVNEICMKVPAARNPIAESLKIRKDVKNNIKDTAFI